MQKAPHLFASMLLAAGLVAQSNVVQGLDGRLTDISNFTVMGSNATYVGCAAQNDMCNPGSVVIPWYAAGGSGQMQENHPKFGFLVCRLLNDRFEQISNRSFCKHAFLSVNGSGGCGTCQDPGTGSVMGVHCTDAYGVGNNGDRYWLGPAQEIDPWLGTWNHVGSYFDQGDPNVGAPANADGVRSPINIADSVTNRVTIKKSDLGLAGAQYFYQIHLIHQGESVANRGDNLMSRGVTFTAGGGSFASSDNGSSAHGSILTRWNGASVTSGGNGNDDGRFFIAVKVTGPVAGIYHYEYAIHNVDNSRGGASFRVPICPSVTASNFSFRDIDDNALDDWTAARVGNEIVFTAPANNPLDWNTIYNFGFDCTTFPGPGNVTIDEARIGPGALSVTILSQAPNGAPASYGTVNQLGFGCGLSPAYLSTVGMPVVPNPSFALTVTTIPNTGVVLAYSFGTANIVLAPWLLGNCTQYLDPATLGVHGFIVTDASGHATVPLPIPAGLQGFTVNWQGAHFLAGGPLYGAFGLTSAIQLVATVTGGCP